MIKKIFTQVTVILLIIAAVSCNKEKSDTERSDEERLTIQNYLSENDTINFSVKPSGLYFYELQAGTGLAPEANDTAYVFYGMQLLSGVLIESNFGSTDTLVFPVGKDYVLPCLDEGIRYMRTGSVARIVSPSSLAYGTEGNYIIGGYTPLLFNVKLVKLVKASK
ncbi:MAG TPA: FKBP-type peptidyl-prolyl cis-trans isomerase [Bacteroidales bacterium]|nr:FKBP-type peptidyl-prolyl cis-trans isomerase [Bacteroidales bacterium]